MSDVEKQELDNQRYMVENNMFRTHGDVQINIAELFSQDLHTDELVDKEFSEEAISNLIELSKDETYLKDLNEQLKQLIEQLIKEYERENPENLARNSYYCLATNKYIEFYTDKFMEWQLASRPTCGQEQRKFLDEKIICPHCNYTLSYDDMYYHNLFDIAKNEDTADVECTLCRQIFHVRGSYTPQYESFKT